MGNKYKDGPSACVVRSLLDYDPLTGQFTWKRRPDDGRLNRYINARFAGKAAGTTRAGRMVIGIGRSGRQFYAHRLAWLCMTGEWPSMDVDHKNGNPLDNRWENLRLATAAQNRANCKMKANKPIPLKGVTFHKGRYMAQLRVQGKKSPFLGYFDTAEEAHKAYVEAARIAHGEFHNAG